MILAHRIALDPTVKQERYFRRACGVARFTYNWGLAEWKKQYASGQKPSSFALKKQFNAIRHEQFPWSAAVTKCASAQAFSNLGRAFNNFFRDVKKPKGMRKVAYPKFKKKGRRDSFALFNDQFGIDGTKIRMPHIGHVRMREPLRFAGKIMGATVFLKAGRWFVSIQVEMPDNTEAHAISGSIVGIDVGIAILMKLSRPLPDGTKDIENPKALRMHKRRMSKLQRRISRQELQRRKANAKRSNRQTRRKLALSKLHYRIANIRKDVIHKATTKIANCFETIVLEDLCVSGLVKNHNLAGAIHDAAFGEVRRQFEYKAGMRGGTVTLADRFFPSSKCCSVCGCIVDKMPLSVRTWECRDCGAIHDRDENAAKNLELVGQAMPEPSKLMAMTTHGDIEALAVPSGTTKLRWENRELNRRAHARTN